MVHKHDTIIMNKLVDQQLMRDTIKNYLHDFEVQIKHDHSSALVGLKDELAAKAGIVTLQDITDKTNQVKN